VALLIVPVINHALLADALAPQLVQANIRRDAVQPSVEATLKTERLKAVVDLDEGLLIGVASVLGRAQQVERDAHDRAIVQTHELLEGVRVLPLRGLNQGRLAERRRLRRPAQGDGFRFR
jgi:YD repeat-containing protein